jgi:1,4-alpha-glucan branching enzyme
VNKPIFSLVLKAHIPWKPHNEERLFESIFDSFLPLLETFDRLEIDRIPFQIGVSFSPALCFLLSDKDVLKRFDEWLNKRIDFLKQELNRTCNTPENTLAHRYYKEAVDKKLLWTDKYERNILKTLGYYQEKGSVELLMTAATYAFLPFYAYSPEAVQAQIETAIGTFRHFFGKYPLGFFLPEIAWDPDIDRFLRAYNFGYTIMDAHAFALGNPAAQKGVFYPIRTKSGVLAMARDIGAQISPYSIAGCYRDNSRDIVYELPKETFKPFFGNRRTPTGCKYYARNKNLYNPDIAAVETRNKARTFLNAQSERLSTVSKFMPETPISLCVCDIDDLGRSWNEGCYFVESLFREAKASENVGIKLLSPGVYLFDQELDKIETITPSFSSSGTNGYAEMWLDYSNDWMYRHMIRAIERMTELAERFPNESGIKERSLNQAAREILIAQDSSWPRMLYNKEYMEYASKQIEGCLQNFTTIYESLGSGHISTEWLTNLEYDHRIFPNINYRVFRRNQ